VGLEFPLKIPEGKEKPQGIIDCISFISTWHFMVAAFWSNYYRVYSEK